MRLFVAIDLEEGIREKVSRFLDGVRELAPGARWVTPQSLHITLKFIGEQDEAQLAAIGQRLSAVTSPAMEIGLRGHGFFPTPNAARVFWIGIAASPALAALAAGVDHVLAELGIAREERPYSPQLTLARGGGRSGAPQWRKGDAPNATFGALQKRLGGMSPLDFGTMSAREFALYRSQLSPAGSKYTRLQSFALS